MALMWLMIVLQPEGAEAARHAALAVVRAPDTASDKGQPFRLVEAHLLAVGTGGSGVGTVAGHRRAESREP
jgi:hypothetical protein